MRSGYEDATRRRRLSLKYLSLAPTGPEQTSTNPMISRSLVGILRPAEPTKAGSVLRLVFPYCAGKTNRADTRSRGRRAMLNRRIPCLPWAMTRAPGARIDSNAIRREVVCARVNRPHRLGLLLVPCQPTAKLCRRYDQHVCRKGTTRLQTWSIDANSVIAYPHPFVPAKLAQRALGFRGSSAKTSVLL
jgi:hypothetical protein